MPTDYDEIAQDYKESKLAPWRTYAEQWSLWRLLGDVQGLRVLDLACGEGFYTRQLRERGAECVVGVDISREMIELARAQEDSTPLGIEYVCADVYRLELGEHFDVVTASYLLNYARNRDELGVMGAAISRHLRRGGRFVTINNNPGQSPASFAQTGAYGFEKTLEGELEEGAAIRYTCFLDGGRKVAFDNYYISADDHIRMLESNGMRDARWHALEISPEGLTRFGDDYWKGLIQAQPVACLDAVRC